MNPAFAHYALLPDLIDFMIHTDLRILAAANELPEPAYYADRGLSFGSLHNLLVHAAAGQSVWMQRFTRIPNPHFPKPADIPTREALSAFWPKMHAEYRAFIASQTLESLTAPFTFTNQNNDTFTSPLGDLLLHVTDHATYHRGQQNTFLKLADHPKAPFHCAFYLYRRDHPLVIP